MTITSSSLDTLCTIQSGGTPSRSEPAFWGEGVPWVKITDMRGGVIDSTEEQITSTGLENSSAKVFPRGTLLLSIFATIGRTAVLNIDAATNQAIAGLTIKQSDTVDPSYLRRYLDFVSPSLASKARGVAQANINLSILRSTLVPSPPLTDQRRIAAILDKADALRAKRRESIAKLDELVQSVFIDMFGDPTTNSKCWQEGSIEIVSSGNEGLRCGPFGTQLKVHELVESGVPLWGIENVHNNRFVSEGIKFLTSKKAAELKAFATRPGDVLVTRMGTIGRACVVPEGAPEGRISYHLFRVRPDPAKCLPEFLATTICRSGTFKAQLRRLARGAIMAGLNTGLLKEVKFLLPPVDLQSQYLEFVRAADHVAAKHQESAATLDRQFRSLQQAAFSGAL